MIRSLFIILAIFVASRGMIRSLPGDPLETLMAETGTTLSREALQRDLGLDLPFWQALLHDIQSGLGKSLVSGDPVFPTLLGKLGRTLLLSSSALALSLAVALILALYSAYRPSTRRFIQAFARIAITLPTAWSGPLLLYAFAILIPWLEFRSSAALACVTLAIPLAGNWTRLIELRLQDEIREPPFRAALGRGIPLAIALSKHALAPAGGSLLAILGSQWGALLAGTFVVESIFDWPGLGTAWVQAVLQRDYPMVEGATFIGATTCLLGIALGDALQRRWDPRLTRDEDAR